MSDSLVDLLRDYAMMPTAPSMLILEAASALESLQAERDAAIDRSKMLSNYIHSLEHQDKRNSLGVSSDASKPDEPRTAAAPKGKAQKRMHNIVAAMQQYVGTYHTQPEYLNYSDRTFIHDMLYGIGIAITGEHRNADGYRKWQAMLSDILRDTAPVGYDSGCGHDHGGER